MFVPGKHFQPCLVFRYKHSSSLRKSKITALMSVMIQAPGFVPQHGEKFYNIGPWFSVAGSELVGEGLGPDPG
jgi:hypothetical protein